MLPPAVQTAAFQHAQQQAPNLLNWKLFPPIPVEQVARRAVRGMLLGQRQVFAGAQSAFAMVANRVSQAMMGFILTHSFDEKAA